MREESSGVLDTIAKLDISQGEKVEGELDVFIARRDKQRRKAEGERPEEAAWAESVRRHDAAVREQNLWAWLHFYKEQERRHTANYEALLSRYRAGIERCERELGIGEANEREEAA